MLACVAVAAVVAAAAPPGQAEPAPVVQTSRIWTLAGTGEIGASGNGEAARDATLDAPRDTAVAPDGTIYIADTFNNEIRKVGKDGVITRFAGTGEPGYSGDHGPAKEAQLWWPHDVAVDGKGVVYVADSRNNRVRRIGQDGIITTVAGSGKAGDSGDGGPAITAKLQNPKSVAPHHGALYIADSMNHSIRKVSLATGRITHVAGTGEAGYAGDGGPAARAQLDLPQRIAFDMQDDLLVADTRNNRVRLIDPSGEISTIAGGDVAGDTGDHGPATEALLDHPRGIAVGVEGSIYVADSGNHRIRRIDPLSGKIFALAGTGEKDYTGDSGSAREATFDNPRGLTVDRGGRLLIADTYNHVIRMIRPVFEVRRGQRGR